jgi:transposase-like protein
MTECNQETFSFTAHFSRRVEAGFTAGHVSSDGGALLLREADGKIDLLGRLAGCFSDGRAPLLVKHPLAQMLAQRIYGLALGYEDLNDHEQLRSDPLLAVLSGKRDLEAPLAGKSTLNRLELTGSEKAFVLALLQMYVEGVSTRKVSAITEALCGLEVSKSQVSALTQKLDAEVAEWRMRPLSEEYPYLIFDARYEKVRRGGSMVSQGVLVAIGISAAGYREVLGSWVAESESEASWGAVFSELKQRGLRGVRYVVSDDHAGMVKAIERHFQGAVWQRCQVHFVRNALSLCGRQQRPQVLRLMKVVTESATREAAKMALAVAIAELEKKAPKVARLLEECGEQILGVYALPEAHRKRMRTTNMLERQNQELKRRTRVIRVFPHEQSCLRLVTALLMETNQDWMGRIYLRMEEDQVAVTETPAAAA